MPSSTNAALNHDDPGTIAAVLKALAAHGHDAVRVLDMLREVQAQLGWVPDSAVDELAARLPRSRAEIEATLSFYAFFKRSPQGLYRIWFSDNVIDRMAGSLALAQRLCLQLGMPAQQAQALRLGEVQSNELANVGLTACTGMSDQSPALLINERPIPALTPARIDQIAALIRARTPLAEWPPALFVVEHHVRRAGPLLSESLMPGEALRAAIARGPQVMMEEARRSGLRGRGGAGYPAAQKWRACRAAVAPQRYVVCNADEGEPGTFKDRVLLAQHAGKLLEGMAIAGYLMGASRGVLYLRAEYGHLVAPLQQALAQQRARGLLGRNLLDSGFDFDVELRQGMGAYVCGEETALLESLEGRPGRPRNRPPFPATHGYLGMPTAVNNVETLCALAEISVRGAEWFNTLGTPSSRGGKILSVSGDCARPGLYEYAFGVTVAQVLHDCGAQHTLAVQVGGASGVCLSDREFGRQVAFEDVPSAGAFMVFDQSRDMFEVARQFAHFFEHESCGFCTPCRVGTALVSHLMDKIAAGQGTRYELDELERLRAVMLSASHCGLGQTATNPVHDVLLKFRPTYERRLARTDYLPEFNLDAALASARAFTQRDDSAAHLNTTVP